MKYIFSCGDVNGIGLEIFFKMFEKNIFDDEFAICINKETLIRYFKLYKFNYELNSSYLKIAGKTIKVIDCEEKVDIEFGKTTKNAGKLSIQSLNIASDLTNKKEYDALITLPIQKDSLYLAGWEFTGHTDFLEKFYSNGKTLMVLFHKNLRVVPATIHIPLSKVSSSITKNLLLDTINSFNNSLMYNFGIEKPKIAILGLNPHSGENGSFGKEEIEIIKPTIKEVKESGIEVSGAFPADGFFGFSEYKKYDGVISMYHDQGLIPLKLYADGAGVNFTSGLNFVRTSPDHGTAMGITGKGIADYKSLLEAVIEAKNIFKNRSNYEQ